MGGQGRNVMSAVNLDGVRFVEVKSISVNEWHPLPDGQGQPEQVHLWIELEGLPHPVVLRFRSRRPVDSLIVALMTHANAVWGKRPPDYGLNTKVV